MSLKQYNEEFHVEKRKLNVVICICRASGTYKKSAVNEMLEQLQIKLKKSVKILRRYRLLMFMKVLHWK